MQPKLLVEFRDELLGLHVDRIRAASTVLPLRRILFFFLVFFSMAINVDKLLQVLGGRVAAGHAHALAPVRRRRRVVLQVAVEAERAHAVDEVLPRRDVAGRPRHGSRGAAAGRLGLLLIAHGGGGPLLDAGAAVEGHEHRPEEAERAPLLVLLPASVGGGAPGDGDADVRLLLHRRLVVAVGSVHGSSGDHHNMICLCSSIDVLLLLRAHTRDDDHIVAIGDIVYLGVGGDR